LFRLVLLVSQKDPGVDDPGSTDLFRVGTVARVIQVSQLPDGTSRVVLEGLGRAKMRRLTTTTEALRASVELLVTCETEASPGSVPPGLSSAARSVVSLYAEYSRLHERIPDELSGMLSAEGDRQRFAHLVAGHLILPSLEKQEILEATDVQAQLEILRELLVRELEIMRIERKIYLCQRAHCLPYHPPHSSTVPLHW
jgi:ATP-dependent Lon protease